MPELPEVETTKRGLEPHLIDRIIRAQTIRNPNLRWPVDAECAQLTGRKIGALSRRAKYLLVETEIGSALWHLGMSGSLRIVSAAHALRTHDHIIWHLSDGAQLRFHDPRRFGCYLFQAKGTQHPLLTHLGPEPLSDDFSARWLASAAKNKRVNVKAFIMDQRVVVGVGNIYAAESLFLAGIHPAKAAGEISLPRWQKLVSAIKERLSLSINRGGTTLRDFVDPDGEPGYFAQELWVYGREGEACKRCMSVIKSLPDAARQSNYCPKCQRLRLKK